MREDESLSMENQKKMLTDYVSQQAGWNLVEVCEDDRYSGTNFDRPGIKQILDDAKSGKINLILVKDLSRFGRNYIEVSQYIDYIFPSFNIRFIALSDNVDTLDRNSTAMDLMPIMNFVNINYGRFPSSLISIKKNINKKAIPHACTKGIALINLFSEALFNLHLLSSLSSCPVSQHTVSFYKLRRFYAEYCCSHKSVI